MYALLDCLGFCELPVKMIRPRVAICILLCACIVGEVLSLKPNVCKNLEDYYRMENNPNCWHNPDVLLNSTTLIKRRGYPLETYQAITKDGYLLTIFRIPRYGKDSKGIVFLQHPALSSSSIWLDKGNASLGFQIYEAGYDVWLSNSRGTLYSRKHLNLTENDQEYWDHGGFHEMAEYDMPAQLELIRNVTNTTNDGPNIIYIGHSLGGTVPVLYGALFPEESAKYLKVVVAAGAGLTLKSAYVPVFPLLKALSPLVPSFFKTINMPYLFTNGITQLMRSFCTQNPDGIDLCIRFVYFLMGQSTFDTQSSPEWVPIIYSLNPGGTPVAVAIHYLQSVVSGKFQHYDYGPFQNMQKYNSIEPPEYKVEDIKFPILFVSGSDDNVSVLEDTQEIFEKIKSKKAKKYGHMVMPNFNHFDFVYGRKIASFNDNVIKFLNKISTK